MISRVADHCFWLGRYLERAESTARVLAVTHNLALDAELAPEACWLPVVIVAGEKEQFFAKHTLDPDSPAWGELVARYMTWDEDNHTSILRSVSAARENARSVRDVVSMDAWEAINELYLWMSKREAMPASAAHVAFEADRYGFYGSVRRSIQLCLGLMRSTMLHDMPLDFIWLGVMLERVGQTARVLDVHHHAFTHLRQRKEVVETALWLSLLRACSGFEPFMKRNQGKVTGDAVASFLIFERDFPRSIRFCLDGATDRFFQHIRPANQPSLPGAETAARLGALAAWLRARSAEPLVGGIHELLTHVVDETAAICNDLSVELFGYGPVTTPTPPTVEPMTPSPSQTQSQTQAQTTG